MTFKDMTVHRQFAIVAAILVGAVVLLGLYLAGSPAKERARRFDQTRVSDIQMISSAVDAYHAKETKLPASLDLLVSPSKEGGWYVRSIVDPETGAAYEYQPGEGKSYKLCAVFNLPSDENDPYGDPYRPMPAAVYPGGEPPLIPDWTHPAGRHCFDLTVNEGYGPMAACGLTNPCQAGQTCASLPDGKGTYCVPQGKECQAAGCAADRCVIMESYPVQVRCTDEPVAPPPDGSQCELMKEKKTGKVDCFGCSATVCKDPAGGWELYTIPPGSVGIPYSCYDAGGTEGCQLAQ